MINISDDTKDRFLRSLHKFEQATLLKNEKKSRLLSLVEVLLQEREAVEFLYEQMPQLEAAGLFQDTVWEKPQNLVSGLVGGTLLGSYPTGVLELLSELRILAIAQGQLKHPHFTADQASHFLQSVLVKNFDYISEDFTAAAWKRYPKKDLMKIRFLFDFLLEKIPVESLKALIFEEIETQAAIRPILDHKIKNILTFIHEKVPLNDRVPVDRKILQFHDVLFAATPNVKAAADPEAYGKLLEAMDEQALAKECELIGQQMKQTSLVSLYHVQLLKYVAVTKPDLVAEVLALNDHGRVDFERHQALVLSLITDFITSAKPVAVYGLAKVLERNLLSQRIAYNAFNRLLQIKVHASVAQQLQKGNLSAYKATPIQLLVSGALCVLGLPLGVRQGHNPTCQSARGISMWSRNAPGKLIDLIIDAATANNLIFRYKSNLIESAKTAKGLVHELDYKLDPVSIVLVPHLDKVYNEMMLRAGTQHPAEDPHALVNPAFYGHWIQTGFFSVFDSTIKAVKKFDEFVKTFYASFHPEYNGGHHLAYPIPLGIFITNAAGTLQGFHAISLLRFGQHPEGQWRVYFFNPNSEGHQDWGQGIRPTVAGNGERYGESSLPVYQFVARLYAYHYNKLRVGDWIGKVPAGIVKKVEKLAKESWGKSYWWVDGN